ncbi:MAG: Tn7 transposase TnsA N-terminal domain-containing protein [Paraglaciecola sp.]|uniref:Tn7 transposase TnsA N-terminal domain-containing protein n=1 Tax=Alishewanella sp. HL-SH05 TaxID=3461145 RepID=UPI00275AE61A|nr:Tn7 transposase TnsA N-terminal domain-containing protein [Paraglaciecola sp.]
MHNSVNKLQYELAMPARKITKSAVANISRFTSVNKSEPTIVESYNELLACYHFEFSAHVEDYAAQPIKFRFKDNETGDSVTYTPDFWVKLKNGQEFYVEVKEFATTQKHEFIQWWERIQRNIELVGSEIKLFTDRELRRGKMEENLKLLHRYLTKTEINDNQIKIIELIRKEPLTISEISKKIGSSLVSTKSLVLNLVSRKILAFNIYEEITGDTVLWMPQQ